VKQGELLRDYLVTTKPTNNDAGKCLWAFAEKDGHEYFVKQFLELKRPRAGSMGSAESKRLQLRACDEFERRHRSVMDRIDPDDLDAGNIVSAVDFFCEGTTYYKITERVHPAELPASPLLTPLQRKVLLRTLGDSLQLLHRLGVVHGDLKPDNIMVEERPGPVYIAKLIDFDDAYVSGSPPGPKEIGGDIMYGAPEWLRYNQDDSSVKAADLTAAADMFALGLVTHEYLTGTRPGHHGRSPAASVNEGLALELDPRLHRRVERLIRSLLSADPAARPGIAAFLAELDDESVLDLVPERSRPAPGETRRASRVRFGDGTAGPGREPGPAPAPGSAPGSGSAPAPGEKGAPSSRLRINLDGRRF
jgi:eukaryotic-like serine/threonine-protein kinase